MKKHTPSHAGKTRAKSPRRRRPAAGPPEKYRLQLYITGTTPRSTQAVKNLHALCEEHLPGRYELEIIDLYQEPDRAAAGQIIASPTLVKQLPRPLMRMVGNLANREQLMIKLHLAPNSSLIPSPS